MANTKATLGFVAMVNLVASPIKVTFHASINRNIVHGITNNAMRFRPFGLCLIIWLMSKNVNPFSVRVESQETRGPSSTCWLPARRMEEPDVRLRLLGVVKGKI